MISDGRGFVLVGKFTEGVLSTLSKRVGGLCPRHKNDGRDYVHLYKNGPGRLCPGGILSYTQPRVMTGPTKNRKGLMPPKRTEKNILAPKRTFICHFILLKCMLKI